MADNRGIVNAISSYGGPVNWNGSHVTYPATNSKQIGQCEPSCNMNPPVSELPSGSCHRDLSYPGGCRLPSVFLRKEYEGGTSLSYSSQPRHRLFTLLTHSLVVYQVSTTQSIMSICTASLFIYLIGLAKIIYRRFLHFLTSFQFPQQCPTVTNTRIWNHNVPQFLMLFYFTLSFSRCEGWHYICLGLLCWTIVYKGLQSCLTDGFIHLGNNQRLSSPVWMDVTVQCVRLFSMCW